MLKELWMYSSYSYKKVGLLLKNAWLKRWNKQIKNLELDKIKNKNPIWDISRKCNYFSIKSFSFKAKAPAILIVKKEENIRIFSIKKFKKSN